MNDVKSELSPRDVDEKKVHPHDGEQPKVEAPPKESTQRPGTPPQTPKPEDETIAIDSKIEPTGLDGDSEAETLIESPEKRRQRSDNTVTLEAKRLNGVNENKSRRESNDVAATAKPRKRKRDDQENVGSSSAVRASSPRSSALSSPGLSSEVSAGYTSESSSRRSTVYSKASGSRRSDNADRRSEEIDDRDDGRLQDRKRRLSSSLHGDHKQSSAKQREKGGSGTASLSERRETRSATYPRHSSNERSVSPQSTSRSHKRGHSGQTTQSSFTTAATAKKQRLPPPLITSKRHRSEDRQSVSTNNSTSPAPSVPHLRKLVSTENDAVSPMKLVGQHRKHRDQNGRTWLARACANDELEQAKAYYDERPSDLNLPDNAGNTPLQIAALSGFANIVKFLVSKSCEVDTKNIDNDTPLIDAVENGHLDVIKLLLDHGANPRLGNAKGDEPYELVPSDIDNYNEIRQLLSDARTKEARRRQSEDHVGKDGTSRAASAVSPRDSPPILGPKSPPFLGTSSRRRTGRSESSRKDLLWQHHTQSNLTRLASTGDLEGVANVLNSLQKAEPDSVIAAARAGHDEVLSFLLGMGNPDPDPDPSLPTQHKRGLHTPILAAIGRGNNKVVQLLLDQNGFNPRRKFEGMTYPEISMKRKGEGWEEECKLLKQAYENARSPKSRKHESPRKHRDQEKLESRLRDSSSPVLRKPPRSPNAHHRDIPLKVLSKDVKRDFTGRRHLSVDSKPHLRKSNSGDHSTAVISDQDGRSSETHVKKHRTRRSQSDLPSMAPDGEGQKKRRLMSRKDHRELHNHRFHDSSSEEETSRQKKKEGPTITKLQLKRYRSSASPDRPRSGDSTMVRHDIRKRRRVFASSESPEDSKSLTARKKIKGGGDPGYSSEHSKQGREVKVLRDVEEIFKDRKKQEDQVPTPSDPLPMASTSQQSSKPVTGITAVLPPEDTEMMDVEPDAKTDDEQHRAALAAAAEKANAEAAEKVRVEAEAAAAAAAAAEKARVEEETRLEAERQEKLRIEAEEKERAERIAKEEEERRLKEEAEAAAEAEAKRLKQEEEERLRREEEEKAAAEAAAEAARKRAEEEAAAAEAAAAALRKKEEEERRERLRKEEEERQERMAREREERQRALEERRRREAEERERQRREALPPLFAKHTELVERNDPIARDHTWLKLTFPIRHAELGQIDPTFAQSEARRELFITNFQAALLLATKDFNLTPFTQLERKPATEFHRRLLFNTFKAVLWIDYTSNGPYLSPAEAHRRTMIVEPKFMVMDSVFWIRPPLSEWARAEPLCYARENIISYPIPRLPGIGSGVDSTGRKAMARMGASARRDEA
ncbi:MAG: hypothetical protein Q9160_006333 [Pyrenula sp. 1 TL-2023]